MSQPTSLIVVAGTTYYHGGYGGPPTNYPIPTPKSSFQSEYDRTRNIISTGQKVGIGIGVTIGVLAILGCIATACIVSRQRTKRRQRIEAEQKTYRMSTASTAPSTTADANPYATYNNNTTTTTASPASNLTVPTTQAPRSESGHYQPNLYSHHETGQDSGYAGMPRPESSRVRTPNPIEVASDGRYRPSLYNNQDPEPPLSTNTGTNSHGGVMQTSDTTQMPTQLPPSYQQTTYTPGNA